MARKKHTKMGSIGQMGTTTKLLLGAGAVSVAAYLLWRFWPQEAATDVPVYPAITPKESGTSVAFGHLAVDDLDLDLPDLPKLSFVEGSCPTGYVWNSTTRQCELYVE